MTQGRWPTNVILAPDMAKALDDQTGELHSQDPATRGGTKGKSMAFGDRIPGANYADKGGASKFFLSAWYEPEELAWIYAVGLTPYGQE